MNVHHTEPTSMLMRLNSSKQPHAPTCTRPLKMLAIAYIHTHNDMNRNKTRRYSHRYRYYMHKNIHTYTQTRIYYLSIIKYSCTYILYSV